MEATGEYSKVDPKNAKILALPTRLEATEQSANAKSAHATTRGGVGGGNNDQNNVNGVRSKNNPTGSMTGQIATWRTIKKGPTATAPDGTTVYWCPRHVHPNRLFNGSYGWHKPKEYDSWKAALESRSNAQKKGTANNMDTTTPEASQQGSNKLTISQRLKEVLCSKLMFSDADADEYCKDVCQSKY